MAPRGNFLSVDSTELTAAFRVGTGPVQLKQITGFNDADATRYVQLHDSAEAPEAGAVPRYTMLVPAGGTYLWQPGQGGRRFLRGLWVCSSSTPGTLTAASAAVWVDAQGITL